MTKPIQAAAQHKHATRNQHATLEALIEESRSRVPADEPPTSYVRARSITPKPMGPVLAAIFLTAIRHSGSEKEQTLLALAGALENIEKEMHFADESREFVRNDEEVLIAEEAPNSMCSKIPFVEMMFEEAQRVDRASLRVLLRYIEDVVKGFDEELERRDREIENVQNNVVEEIHGGRSGNVTMPVEWREPRW